MLEIVNAHNGDYPGGVTVFRKDIVNTADDTPRHVREELAKTIWEHAKNYEHALQMWKDFYFLIVMAYRFS